MLTEKKVNSEKNKSHMFYYPRRNWLEKQEVDWADWEWEVGWRQDRGREKQKRCLDGGCTLQGYRET